MAVPTGGFDFSGLFSSIGDGLGSAGNFLLSDAGMNMMKMGGGLFNMMNQNKMMKHNMGIQNRQMDMTEDAYKRDVEASERRRKLDFG
jgi:hypothetical protein